MKATEASAASAAVAAAPGGGTAGAAGPAGASGTVRTPAPESDAVAALERINRELTLFARRARASASRMHPQLSFVAYTLLGHLEAHDGCRATDLAAHYALDKSTVSRQIGALERAGLVERRTPPDDRRGRRVHLTPDGRRVLAEVTARRREVFRQRLAGWPEEDLDRFADYLERYNARAEPFRP